MVLCGATGWTRPDWTSVVFPRVKPRDFHPLEYLAHCLDLMEIEASFDGPLRPELAGLWCRKVRHNPRFRFTVQLPRQLTHDRQLDPETISRFREGLQPILDAGRLGCVLMRFPWSFRFTRENREFLIELRRALHPLPLAAELRHSTWTLDEALGALMDYRIGFCNVDQPAGARALGRTSIITSQIAYVRLLGRGGSDWTQEEAAADYLYTPLDLSQWQQRIERLATHTSAVFVVAANGVAGKSVINAMQLRSTLLEQAPPRHRGGSPASPNPAVPNLRCA